MRIGKQMLMLAVALPGFAAHGPCGKAEGDVHVIEKRTDARGRTYEAVTNDPTGTRIYTLKNGLTVFLAQNRDEPRVRAMLTVRSGGAFDPDDNTGLAHYLEHLLFNGTDSIGTLDWSREKPLLDAIERTYEEHRATSDAAKKRTLLQRIDSLSVAASKYAAPDEYRKLLSSLGGVAVNGFTDYDVTAYWCLVNATSLEHFLRLECERLRKPALRAFQHELEIVYQEFNEQQDNVLRRKRGAVHRQLFPRHPYGQHKLIGTAEHLRNPSIPAIRAYYERYYVPGNMALVLVGDLAFEETVDQVERTFGNLVARPVTKPELPKEAPITSPKDTTLYGAEESVYIGFRFSGGSSTDVQYATLTDMVLNNGFAGLMDIELNGKQRVGAAGTTVYVMAEHAVHYMDGKPKQGQTLEEVRDLILAQVQRIADGDFEEWVMKGALNDLRKQEAQSFSSMGNLSAEMMRAFYLRRPWAERLDFLDAMGRITKQQLMDFVRTRYTERSIVYMRKGTDAAMVRLEKPPITSTEQGGDKRSVFATRFTAVPQQGPTPVFVDYNAVISRHTTAQGIELSFVENTANALFQLDLIFNMGRSRELALAMGYLPLLGTDDRSPEDIKKAFYELGLQFTAECGTDRTYLHLEGLEQHAREGIALLDDLLAHVKADTAVYRSYIEGLLSARAAQATDKNAIMDPGLKEWALYGPRSPAHNTFTAAELRAMDPAELVVRIHTLRDFQHRIFYFGTDAQRAVAMFDAAYHARPHKAVPPAGEFPLRTDGATVYFVDRDLVQADVMLLVPGKPFSVDRVGASNFFSPYMDHQLHNQLRLAGAIAYNTSAAHYLPRDTTGSDHTVVRFSAQADKLPEALHLATAMLKELPGTQADIDFVRDDQLKRYDAERITGTDLFWNSERYKRRGIYTDARRAQYDYVREVDLAKLRAFFNENIAGRPMHILVVGSRAHIDMKALGAYGTVEEVNAGELFK